MRVRTFAYAGAAADRHSRGDRHGTHAGQTPALAAPAAADPPVIGSAWFMSTVAHIKQQLDVTAKGIKVTGSNAIAAAVRSLAGPAGS